MTKVLIDECLSPELALMARERGHHEASHVVWIGKAGWKDWELKRVILEQDWVLVTRNSDDFRGPRHAPGTSCLVTTSKSPLLISTQRFEIEDRAKSSRRKSHDESYK
jgi:hypothetical protein